MISKDPRCVIGKWRRIRAILKSRGIEDAIRKPVLTPHDIDAMAVTLAGCLNIERQAEVVGDEKEGRLVVPKMDRSDLQQ
jgi:hypothetical protein